MKNNITHEKIYNLKELADSLGSTEQTVRKYIKQFFIKPIKLEHCITKYYNEETRRKIEPYIKGEIRPPYMLSLVNLAKEFNIHRSSLQKYVKDLKIETFLKSYRDDREATGRAIPLAYIHIQDKPRLARYVNERELFIKKRREIIEKNKIKHGAYNNVVISAEERAERKKNWLNNLVPRYFTRAEVERLFSDANYWPATVSGGW